ncbi:hypothetical protein DSM14862_04467 (plasmid) [Sulfitobacter indolifex]|uniref:hypothetical protein n=1 Tax=Sulfitobacter indolifex TaxID=225422 RepID=UPI001FABF5F5|nr:hypothetical protein [Sulfitobacter indolifex]UOA21627.1 hypothetical protein DSM14862_04467 [Sulfitobacter indolifex]
MSIESNKLKEAKAALKGMSSKRQVKLTKQQFVASLIEDIHAKMEAGFQMSEICEELNKTLPPDEQIKMSTFKAYVRAAREEAGIKPLKSWTRRTPRESKDSSEGKLEDNREVSDKKIQSTKTEGQFRNMVDL